MGLTYFQRRALNKSLKEAYKLSAAGTSNIPGDIPSLVAYTHSLHFKKKRPSFRHNKRTAPRPVNIPPEDVIAILRRIPPLRPNAQALLDRALSILTNGPQLSINSNLEDGQELPVTLHTLLASTIWTCLIHGGADPNLERTTQQAHACRIDYTQDDKSFWFLCKRFFQVHEDAELGGDVYRYPGTVSRDFTHRIYDGRLVTMLTSAEHSFNWARMPSITTVTRGYLKCHIAQTHKGLWGWYWNGNGVLGMGEKVIISPPTRLTFPACPEVDQYEASLPPWEKHRLVKFICAGYKRTFIVTPVGVVVAGENPMQFSKDARDDQLFHRIPLPDGFIPDHIIDTQHTVVMTMGDQQVIAGSNRFGRLGLGHTRHVRGFQPAPLRIDKLLASKAEFHLFYSERKLLLLGECPCCLVESGLLPDCAPGQVCLNPAQLHFTERASAFFLEQNHLVWVTAGKTQCWCPLYGLYELPFEAAQTYTTESSGQSRKYRYCDRGGTWFELMAVSEDSADLVEFNHDGDRARELVVVDIDPECAPSEDGESSGEEEEEEEVEGDDVGEQPLLEDFSAAPPPEMRKDLADAVMVSTEAASVSAMSSAVLGATAISPDGTEPSTSTSPASQIESNESPHSPVSTTASTVSPHAAVEEPPRPSPLSLENMPASSLLSDTPDTTVASSGSPGTPDSPDSLALSDDGVVETGVTEYPLSPALHSSTAELPAVCNQELVEDAWNDDDEYFTDCLDEEDEENL
ncbi:hypothetical protein J8273_6268 [Carpediemonas membranifera]|uniref:Uncharacterized protein n=1 Tax=Carpediemonas membranifera TaxID=201153 RepID=A0A8J6BVK6_9EUKA|nr:hypothetical protein J8273_6268 [Carpediemonas membranifera]|eukprot:KAG9391506.1 hypothetical protein J8273_6268 [Carpediemonas membranifera]